MIARNYGPRDKAQAVAALLCGERPRVVSRRFGIPEGTVKSWRHRIKTGRMQPEKRGRVGDLLLDHTKALLRSLTAQNDRLRDPGLIAEIPAKELAVLWGSLFDRTMRMLELCPALRRQADKKGGSRGA